MTMRMKWYGDKAKAAVRKGAARGLMLGAEHVLEEANRIVPIAPDGGTLLRSGVPSVDEGALQAAVSYDTPYACRQHEELSYHHDVGKQAKYLETPLDAAKADGTVEELIAREVRRALGT